VSHVYLFVYDALSQKESSKMFKKNFFTIMIRIEVPQITKKYLKCWITNVVWNPNAKIVNLV